MISHDAQARDLTRQELSEEVDYAVKALCDLKLQMDRYARGTVGQPFLDDWMDARNTCAYTGDALLHLILPFLRWGDDKGEYFRAYVNPSYVLGASIKGFPEHIKENKVPERIARYAQTFGSRDNVAYVWLKALGVFWAYEGKHRVAFMRAHEQPVIAAWVREASYPSADRLLVIEPNDDQDEWLALLDARYLQVLRRPRMSMTLLRAYGVKTVRWNALASLPNEQLVRTEIRQRRLHCRPENNAEQVRTLDLKEFRERLRDDDERITRSIFELEPYSIEWRTYFVTSVICGVLGMLIGTMGNSWLRDVGFLSGGVSLGLVLALHLMRFVGPKRTRRLREIAREDY